jgi:hypothetical protein
MFHLTWLGGLICTILMLLWIERRPRYYPNRFIDIFRGKSRGK